MKYKILVGLTQHPNNWSAYAPEVDGCIATGKTRDEALKNMREALQSHLSWLAQEGDSLPEIETDEAAFVDVDVPIPSPVS